MANILSKLLEQRGITRDELNTEEENQFKQWESVLNKDVLTIEDLKAFIEQQVTIIEAKWKDYDVSQEKKNEFIPYFTVYKTILGAIDAPKREKVALEQYLTNLIKQ